MIIAIDGPAGAGKSTIARALAARLGFAFLDTGALYRCAVLAGLLRDAAPEEIVAGLDIQLGERVLLDGQDVTQAIRDPEISRLTPSTAARPQVRAALTDKQRELLSHGNWVAEGRDIGTVVAPAAELKIFLTASVDERTRRRASEHGQEADAVRLALIERDRLDSTREHGPLYAASDAIEMDTTELTTEEVVEAVIALVPESYTLAPALFAVGPADIALPRRGRRQAVPQPGGG
jgi:cytidylate kinase